MLPLADLIFGTLLPANRRVRPPDRAHEAPQVGLLLWRPTGKPVAHSSTPVGRNPEQEHPAEAGGLESKGRSRETGPPSMTFFLWPIRYNPFLDVRSNRFDRFAGSIKL